MTRDAGRARRRGRAARATTTRRVRSGVIGLLVVVLGAAAVYLTFGRPAGEAGQAPWARLGTADVHSLAFVGGDPERLLFGHHGGLLESRDGGRSWSALPLASDAMALGAAGDGSIVVAGHEVFRASADGGRTWTDLSTDLPSLDIHGFTRDPNDAARMWAYLAIGGLWESRDGGSTFVQASEQNIVFPVAVRASAGTRLIGITAVGLAESLDGGRTWTALASPELFPMTALAATDDGRTLVAGGVDALRRSDDGGSSWLALAFTGTPLAIAVAAGGGAVALVTDETEFFRSADGGTTWPGP